MKREFLKMNGLGNDFVIIDGRTDNFKPSVKFITGIADRKRGVGCDQLIILRQPRSPNAQIFMDMFNADASPVRSCGNATRCVAQILFDETTKNQATIETLAGILSVTKAPEKMVTVDFGKPYLLWHEIPLSRDMDTLNVDFKIESLVNPCCVNMGNPHAVFFVPSVDHVAVAEIGPKIEHAPLFPDRVNVEFAEVKSRNLIRMRVWERGVGITEACGSGACATLVAAVRRGLTEKRATIVMDGGSLEIEWNTENGHVLMTGTTGFSFRGMIDDEQFY